MDQTFPGTDGYAAEAPGLIERYETLPFDAVHAPVLHLMPSRPVSILDIGAGAGRDAAHLAALGHSVVAAEPTAPFIDAARASHAQSGVLWLQDGLPDLAQVRDLDRTFDLILLTAVWMHLDEAERGRAMPVVAAMLAPAGRLIMMLRYGPVPSGRRMFQIPRDETRALAAAQGLELVHDSWNLAIREPNRGLGVHWNRLAFERP